MERFLNLYYKAKLEKYQAKMDEHSAELAAKFALDDMIVTVKRNLEIYNRDEVKVLLFQEIEDVRACI